MWDPGESLINFHFHRLVPSLAWFSKCVNKSGHALDFLVALEKKKNEPAQVSFSPGQSPETQELWFHVQGVLIAQRETLVIEQFPEWELSWILESSHLTLKASHCRPKRPFLCFCLPCLFLDPWLLPILYAQNMDSEKNKVADRYKG